MNRQNLLLISVLAGCVVFGGRASAQDVSSEPPPAYISAIDGAATLVRDGRAEAATSNMPLLEGDRLRTDAGRLEVFMPDGSLFHLDQNSVVDLLSDSLMRLMSGRLIFVVSGRPDERPSLDYHIDAAAGSVQILRPGEYRVSLVRGQPGPDVELAVVRGEASLSTDRGSVSLGAGQLSTAAEGYAPAYAGTFNSARLDEFERWSADRVDSHLGYSSQQYLPAEVQVFSSTFDRYGTWEDVEPYGYVWYPTVAVGWRPYYDGYWRTVGPYGWTWIGYDPWCWPTHHYGRWGIGTHGWYWIPGHSWGAAWVSWGMGASYVSWCPLGWNNHAVVDLSFGFYWNDGHRHDPWSAWTVVPRRDFGGFGRVPAVALHADALRAVPRNSVVMQRDGPPVVGRATARPFGTSSATVRGTVARRAGGGALPGGGSGRPIAVSRGSAVAAAGPSTFERRGNPEVRTSQSATGGLPPRDPRSSTVARGFARPAAREPVAAPREEPARTYDPTPVVGAQRQAQRTGPAIEPERRAPETLGEVAARTNAARRSPDPAQRDAGNRVYTSAPQDYRRSAPQAIERNGGLQTVRSSPAPARAQDSRFTQTTPAYERRAPTALAAPRVPDRSWTSELRPSQAAPAYERRMPDRAPMPQVSSAARPDRAVSPSGMAPPPRVSAPSSERTPRQAAPAGSPARSSSAAPAGGIRRR